jgi:hypothetical protein
MKKRKAIKYQILLDFMAEWLELQNTGRPHLSIVWTMYFDGSRRVKGVGGGAHITSRRQVEVCAEDEHPKHIK